MVSEGLFLVFVICPQVPKGVLPIRYKVRLFNSLSVSNAFHCFVSSNISLKSKGIVHHTEQTDKSHIKFYGFLWH